MVYTAMLKRISRDLSDEIDEWHEELAKRGVVLSREDISVIMSLVLERNKAKQINIIVKESTGKKMNGRHTSITHKLEPDFWNTEIEDLLNKEVKLVNGRLMLV